MDTDAIVRAYLLGQLPDDVTVEVVKARLENGLVWARDIETTPGGLAIPVLLMGFAPLWCYDELVAAVWEPGQNRLIIGQLDEYPDTWPQVAERTKEQAGWRCVRCGHPHSTPSNPQECDELCDLTKQPSGHQAAQAVLTVHHLDGNKCNLRWFNLVALCQACHLSIQARVQLEQVWPWEHSDWFKPYVAGWYAWRYLGLYLPRWAVVTRQEQLLALERRG